MFGWSGTSERASWYPSTDSASSVQLHDPRLYARAGYPLVYYAQVEPGGGPLRSRPLTKKDNPNCFVKAFRWYTQEHNVHKTTNYDSETDEKKGYPEFATWLDQKYDQFLKDRRLKNDPSAARLNGQSSIQQNRTKRTYLPWKKRPRALNSQDGGDRSEKIRISFNNVYDASFKWKSDKRYVYGRFYFYKRILKPCTKRCSQSFETILHPKVLTRPASERCFANKTATCCDSSKVTVTLSDTRIIAKISGQRCLGGESEEKEIHVTTMEAFAGGIDFNQSTTQVEIRNSRYNLCGPQKGFEKKHVECQCIVMEHRTCLCPTESAEYQCDNGIVTEQLTCLCPNKLVNKAETSDQLEKKDIQNYFSSPSPIPITLVIKNNGTEISSEKYDSPKEPVTNDRSTQYYETDAKLPRNQASGAADLARVSAGDRRKFAERTRFQAQNTKKITKGVICECRLFEEVEWRCPARHSIEAVAQTSDHVVTLVNPCPLLLRVVGVAALAGAPARAPSTTNNTYGL